jgi:hypothetical protein
MKLHEQELSYGFSIVRGRQVWHVLELLQERHPAVQFSQALVVLFA